MCGKVTIAEVEEIVDNGALEADNVHTPGIFVQRVVLNKTARETHSKTATVRAK